VRAQSPHETKPHFERYAKWMGGGNSPRATEISACRLRKSGGEPSRRKRRRKMEDPKDAIVATKSIKNVVVPGDSRNALTARFTSSTNSWN
jgi:hypothetical protein